MNRSTTYLFLVFISIAGWIGCQNIENTNSEPFEEEMPKEFRIGLAMKENFERTKDVNLGYPPSERLLDAYDVIKKKEAVSLEKSGLEDIRWIDRGPRRIGGRTRAILVSKLDPTKETVFSAGVAGGIWKTTQISAEDPEWEPISDNFENLAVTTIVQDPSSPNMMYFGTGEGYFNGDAVRGLGIWRSFDGGESWEQLASTNNSDFYYNQRMVVYSNGDVYSATSTGLYKSTDQGETWTKVLGNGISGGHSNRINDIKVTSNGDIYATVSFNDGPASRVYKSPSGPNVGDLNSWTYLSGSGLPTNASRIELAVTRANPNQVYALTAVNRAASGLYVTKNGGTSWNSTNFPSGIDYPDDNDPNTPPPQSWYDLTIGVDPNNPDRVIIGAVGLYMSTNGGVTWSNITRLHVDQHWVLWDNEDSNVIYFGNDGGIYRVPNGIAGPSQLNIRNKNLGYNVTQFYACAIHPDEYSNFFLAGAQDNGTQQFSFPGFGNTRFALGGDGGFCHIDQDNPNFQVASTQLGNYLYSTNGGNNFNIWFQGGTGFINISNYDSGTNKLYIRNSQGNFLRADADNTGLDPVQVNFNGSLNVTAIMPSPNVEDRVYFGANTRLYRVDNASVGTSVNEVQLSGFLGPNISSIAIEKGNEDHILVTVLNYGANSVHETTDGGETWQIVEGDLPDMPVRWGLFNPTNGDQAILATETGIWSTDDLDGPNTVWDPNPSFPNVRTDMLKWRDSDNLIIAATHARGLWSTDAFSTPRAFLNIPQAGYLDTAYDFDDVSVNSNDILWDFGDGTSSDQRNVQKSYGAINTYNVSLTINDGFDQATDQIKILPNRSVPYVIDGSNYGGDFESNTQDFAVYHISGSEFERGRSNILGKDGTRSGQNAMVLAPEASQYENLSHSMIYTPNFSLTEDGIYEISFWAKHNIQLGFDGFRVEYSIDRGLSWRPLEGGEDDKWYNFTNADAEDAAFPPGASYITGATGNEFRQYRRIINDLIGNENLAFRFVFRSNGLNRSAGVAIDDFELKAWEGPLETIVTRFTGEFTSFENVTLNWTTEPEYRNSGFEVQMSTNGRDWEDMGFVNGAGYSVDPLSYEFSLGNVKLPVHYFRLKVIDFDDNFFFSKVLVLTREEQQVDVYQVFPNPFIDQIGINFNRDFDDESIDIEIFDSIGRLVYDNRVTLSAPYFALAVPGLPDGTYVLRITVGEEEIVRKIVRAQ